MNTLKIEDNQVIQLKDAIKIDGFYLYANLNIEAFLTRLRILAIGINLDLEELSFVIE